MSPAQDDLKPIVDTLLFLTHDWLAGFIHAMKNYRATVGLPPPHPLYPLPVQFPFGGLTEVFSWVQVFDEDMQVDRRFRIRMSHIEGNKDRWEPLVWSVYSGSIVFGTVVLDRRIFVDQSLISVDPLFILEGMADAVRRRAKLVVSSRIVMEQVSEVHDENIWHEIFEVRTGTDELLKELGRRRIGRPRFCPECRVWLPHAGPQYCLEHLP